MDHFKTLPEALFDNILKFSDVKDIISFSNTSEEHNEFVDKITTNSQSQVSRVYEMTEICDVETWIFLPSDKFKFKFAKQYYNIYKNLGEHFELDFKEVNHIFFAMFNLVKEIYHLETDEDKNEKYNYIIMTLFEFINTNNYIFEGSFTLSTEKFNSRAKILSILFRLYGQDFSFVNYTEIEAILINMYQELINRLEDVEYAERMDEFIVEYLEGWFYTTQSEEISAYRNIGYIREMLEDMVVEAGMGAMFLIPEEEPTYDYRNNDAVIDIDDLDVNDRINI